MREGGRNQRKLRDHRVLSLEEASEVAAQLRSTGASVGLCHGVFDLLHPGHFRHLAVARKHVDYLIVSITDDNFVNKGPNRPAFPQDLRAEALAGLRDVDYVVISPEPTALTVLRALKPNVYVKGQDYAKAANDPTGNIALESKEVESHGGRVIFTDEIVFSSSNLINRFLPRHSDEVMTWLQEFAAEISVSQVHAYLDRIADLEVTIVGETILDQYSKCEALGKASKEPVLCMRLGETVTFPGGSLAIARNVRALGANVNLITGMHSDSLPDPVVKELEESGVVVRAVATDPRPTIRKWRIVDEQTQSRVIELYEMDDSQLEVVRQEKLMALIAQFAAKSDVFIVADYGHGLISDLVANHLCNLRNFLAVNAQSNAGNRGFNSLSKYSRADFVTMNGGEARQQARRHHVELESIAPAVVDRLSARGLLVTQGGSGTLLSLADGSVHLAPALAPFVTDRVGAGDAVLAVTALLMYLGAPAPVVGLLANLVGAYSVSFVGNERAIDVGSMKRQVSSLLG